MAAGAHVVRAAPQDAAAIAQRPGDAGGLEAAGHRRRPPARGARRWRRWRRLADGGRPVSGTVPRVGWSRRRSSPCRCASLGVRTDGMHLIDAEMVTLDLHDRLEVDDTATATRVERSARSRRRRAGRRRRSGRRGRWRLVGRDRSAAIDKRDPGRRRAGRRERRRGGDPALGRVTTTRRRPPRWAPTCRSASSAAGPGSAGSARSSNRCRVDRDGHAADAAGALLDAGGLPALGRAGRSGRSRRATTSRAAALIS